MAIVAGSKVLLSLSRKDVRHVMGVLMASEVMMADTGWMVAAGGVAGALVGAVGKGLWDVWLAAGKVKADREARAEARRDKRAERRDDLQRQTLLDLQPAILAMARANAKGLFHDRATFQEPGIRSWGNSTWPNELAEEGRIAQAQVTLLRSRVRDSSLRDLIKQVSTAYNAAVLARDEGESSRQEHQAAHVLLELQDRIGQLIREIDDV